MLILYIPVYPIYGISAKLIKNNYYLHHFIKYLYFEIFKIFNSKYRIQYKKINIIFEYFFFFVYVNDTFQLAISRKNLYLSFCNINIRTYSITYK